MKVGTILVRGETEFIVKMENGSNMVTVAPVKPMLYEEIISVDKLEACGLKVKESVTGDTAKLVKAVNKAKKNPCSACLWAGIECVEKKMLKLKEDGSCANWMYYD